jgi:predicted TIM-barrel fold metal-dependent hydrolase
MRPVIVDVHTHIFPPRMIAARAQLAAHDPAFAALYADPRARMATADELLASAAAGGLDHAVAAGFWWSDPALAAEHADYLLAAAAASDGVLLPFVPVAECTVEALRALVARGARGLGELRTAALAPEALDALARAAEELDLPLLVHCSEDVGHAYPGKAGGLTPGALWRLLDVHPRLRVIAAHWGGGYPFYSLMPEVRAQLAQGRLLFDSAASPLLYDPAVFAAVASLAGADCIAWGSDFPLRGQPRDRAAVESALADPVLRAAALGGNAARLLRLPAPAPHA